MRPQSFTLASHQALHRLVAFQEPVSLSGGQELKSLLCRRTAKFVRTLNVLQLLPETDRQQVKV